MLLKIAALSPDHNFSAGGQSTDAENGKNQEILANQLRPLQPWLDNMERSIAERKCGIEIMGEDLVRVSSDENTFRSVLAAIVMASIYSAPAMAAINPTPLPNDSRLGELVYDPDQIFHIQVAKGTATHIILHPGEKIMTSAPGSAADCSRQGGNWCIVANTGANELYVQPRTGAPSQNNLQLTTTVRRYSFEFVQSAGLTGGPAPWYRVTFRYTTDPAALQSAPAGGAHAAGPCNWNYSMSRSSGTSGFAPLAVFDDGLDTYLMLPPGAAVPVLEGAPGGEQLRPAPGVASGQMVMLAGVRTNFTIRSGLGSVAVWNDSSSAPGTGACPAW